LENNKLQKHSVEQTIQWAREVNFKLPMGYRSPKMPVNDYRPPRRDNKNFDKTNKFKRR
jgi:hypothetical protein